MSSPHPFPWEAARSPGAFTLVLVRHGQTAWNLQRRFLGATDIVLDELGHQQAAIVARHLRAQPVGVYTSPLQRAFQTATALHPNPSPMPDLQELHQGDLEGMLAVDAMLKYPDFFQAWATDPGSVTAPGGESLSRAQSRGLRALDQIRSAHLLGELAIAVSHQMVIASTLCAIAGSPLSAWREFRLPNTGVAVVVHNGHSWQIAHRRWAVEDLGKNGGSGLPNV